MMRKEKRQSTTTTLTKTQITNERVTPESKQQVEESGPSIDGDQCVHSAGLDAFMTGYVMLAYVAKYSTTKSDQKTKTRIKLNDLDGLERFVNNVYLSGKDYPFCVQKSHFVACSSNHQAKKIKLQF